MKRIAPWSLAGLSLLVIAGAGYLFWPRSSQEPPQPEAALTLVQAAARKVQLSDAQRNAARLEVEPVTVRELQPRRWVPGHVTYDHTRHLEIIAPVDGVVRELSVRPGDTVAVGQVVAVVDCPEIGERRADVLQLEADWRLAVRERDKAATVKENVRELLQALDRDAGGKMPDESFLERPLGDFREPLFSAYSRLQTAEQLLARLRPLADQGIASGRSYIEQHSVREVALATYRSARENAEFQSEQQFLRSENAAADAARRLSIARERLASLIGTSVSEAGASSEGEPLSHWPVRSPILGTVEELKRSVGERLPQGQGLMVVADTRTLWVEAEVRERDWGALRLQTDDEVQLEFPALPERRCTGRVVFVGRVQSSETRAIPVVVRVDNAEGVLRPGLFARVALAEGEPHEAVTVPATAVQQHESAQFVFVERRPGEFERVDVETGKVIGDQVTLLHGPVPGDRVVTRGAFYLKSELLLEPEE